MPIYEYQCDACGGVFEALRKLSDPPLTQCRLCQAEGQVRKNVTAPAFRLKGSGWYETDFKKEASATLLVEKVAAAETAAAAAVAAETAAAARLTRLRRAAAGTARAPGCPGATLA